jgi:hypothetical protein
MKKLLIGAILLLCFDAGDGQAQTASMPYPVRMLPGTQSRSLPISALVNFGLSPIQIFPDIPVRHCYEIRVYWPLNHL